MNIERHYLFTMSSYCSIQTNVDIRFLLALIIFTVVSSSKGTITCNTRDGWLQYGSSCYLFSDERDTWVEQMRRCEMLGGHLVTINDAAENQFLFDKVTRKGGVYWTGGSDMTLNGTWTWIETNQVFTFTDWGQGEPNGILSHRYEHCVEINPAIHWNDNNCMAPLGRICETNHQLNFQWVLVTDRTTTPK